MKTIDAINIYSVLVNAKLTKVVDVKSKCAIVKILSSLRPIAESFEKDLKSVDKAAEGEGHEEMMSRAQKFNDLSDVEKIEVNKYFIPFNQRKEAMVKEFSEKEVETNFEKIDNVVVEQLIDSNPELTVGQIDLLVRFLVV